VSNWRVIQVFMVVSLTQLAIIVGLLAAIFWTLN